MWVVFFGTPTAERGMQVAVSMWCMLRLGGAVSATPALTPSVVGRWC